jgi:hypothetical protein
MMLMRSYNTEQLLTDQSSHEATKSSATPEAPRLTVPSERPGNVPSWPRPLNASAPSGADKAAPPKAKPAIPRLVRHSRAARNPLVKDNERQGIWNPAGSEKPTSASLTMLNALKKLKDTYKYSDIGRDQVRLLIIKEGHDEDDINAMLQVVDDDQLGTDDYCYEALSYHWGEGGEWHNIIIQDEWNMKPIRKFEDAVFGKMNAEGLRSTRLYVRPNLYCALKRLRAHDRPVALWVDALCINQQDEAEKTIQVMKMNTIYQKAYNVCIWLGTDDPDFHSSRAMTFIKDIIDLRKLETLLTDDRWIPKWASLFQLLKWSWFSRRWVIQELALAQEATVHCGQSKVHWDDFRDAIGIFHRYFKSLQPRLQDPKLGDSKITDLEPLGAKKLVEMTSDLFRRKPDGSFESTMGLEKLVSRLATFNTSDPRDTINSLRNICREVNGKHAQRPLPGRTLPPVPDYTKDLFEVYREFVNWVVEDSQSLDIICRHWALREKESQFDTGPTAAPRLVKLPSWILTAEEGSFGFGEAVFSGRKAGDSFVGLPGDACYSASGRTDPVVEFGESTSRPVPMSTTSGARASVSLHSEMVIHDMTLTVSGYRIGKVHWTSDPIPDGVIPQRGLERLGWNRKDALERKPAPDQLCRTLVAGRGPNGTPVPTYYSRACLYCLLNETPNGHINTKELLSADESNYMQNIVQDYLERVRAVTWNRVILQASPIGTPGPQSLPTTPIVPDMPPMLDHIVGLGPPRTQPRDIIAIFFGCSVPVILRPDGRKSSPQQYKFIGEAYIYGKMDGEVMFEEHQEEKFVLR